MTGRTLALVGLKLLGLSLQVQGLVYGIQSLPGLTPGMDPFGRQATLWTLLPAALQLAIGSTIWATADVLAGRVARGAAEAHDSESSPLTQDQALSVAAAIIGLYFVGDGVPDVARAIYHATMDPGMFGERGPWLFGAGRAAIPHAVEGGVRLIVGLGFLRWSTGRGLGLGAARGWFRSRPLSDVEPEPPPEDGE